MSVVKMYKAKYHKMIKQGDAGEVLEQTERYEVKCHHHKYTVRRL